MTHPVHAPDPQNLGLRQEDYAVNLPRASANILLISLLSLSTSSKAATLDVEADGTGDYATIKDAVDAAVNGDTVLLGPGTFTGPDKRNVYFNGKAITGTSQSGPDATIIDCQSAALAFLFTDHEGPSSELSGLTIRNGRAGSGGAIYVLAASPTIRDNKFIENFATGHGGAIWCAVSDAIITDNLFLGNIADTPSQANGGAIFALEGMPTITNNAFINNWARFQGGAMAFDGSSPSIINNTIVGNHASQGGGIRSYSASRVGHPIIQNTIIAFSTLGQGLSSDGCTVINCDIYGNVGGDGLPPLAIDGGGNFSEDPQFCGPPGSNNYFIHTLSPCAPENHPSATLVGALPVACGGVPVQETTWGQLKSLYRD